MRYSRQKQRPGQFQASLWPATSLSRPGCGDFRKRDHGRRRQRSGRYLADETPAISYCVSETSSEIARLARHDMRTTYEDTSALDRATLPPSRSKQLLRTAIHLLSYHFILTRRRTTVARVAGFRLSVRPTVFHPRYFLSSNPASSAPGNDIEPLVAAKLPGNGLNGNCRNLLTGNLG
jgi:hypothetical protein